VQPAAPASTTATKPAKPIRTRTMPLPVIRVQAAGQYAKLSVVRHRPF
jgi:hypothetical protein